MSILKKLNQGFTQVELVTVLAIMSTLAAVAVPKMMDWRDEAKHVSMKMLAGVLTETSALNAAQGHLRANALRVTQCQDAGHFIENATSSSGQLKWEGRVLSLENATGDVAVSSSAIRQCVLSDAEDANVSPVQFYIRLCADQRCVQS